MNAPGSNKATDFASKSDDELLVAIRRGSVDAYGELWIRHERRALALARRLTSRGADDVVAEAFARILRVVRSGKGPVSNFQAYLSTTIRSLIIDASRVKSSNVVPIGDQTVLAYLSGTVPGPEDIITHGPGIEADVAKAAWESLSERDRAIMWATAVDGYSTAEIAAQMGVSTGRAAVWVHRARQRIRAAFLANQAPATGDAVCDRHRRHLRMYLRGKLSDAEDRALSTHLQGCRGCADAFAVARDVNERIRSAVTVLVPGGSLAGHSMSSPAARLRALRPRRTMVRRFAGTIAPTRVAAVIATVAGTIAAASVAAVVATTTSGPSHRDVESTARSHVQPNATDLSTHSRDQSSDSSPRRRDAIVPASSAVSRPAHVPTTTSLPTTPRSTATRPPAPRSSSALRTSKSASVPHASRPPSVPRGPNLLAPGGFESFAVPDGSYVTCRTGRVVAGWTVVGRSIDVVGSRYLPPPAGDAATAHVIDLVGAEADDAVVPGGIQRAVATHAGTRYRLRFALAGNPLSDQGTHIGHVLINGKTALEFSADTRGRSADSAASMGWVTKTIDFTATSSRTTISLASGPTNGGSGVVVTDVRLQRFE